MNLCLPAATDIAPLHRLRDRHLAKAGVDLRLLRLDLFCPQLAGNKYFKLRDNLASAQAENTRCIISFGGAYSNHLHALAYACACLGLRCVAVIRGERPKKLSPTLQDLESWGATLHFVTRAEYRQRHDPLWQTELLAAYPGAMLIPEGGSNVAAVHGCADIVSHIEHHLGDDYAGVLVPCGSGGTSAGLLAGLPASKTLWSVPVLNGEEALRQAIDRLLAEANVVPVAHLKLCPGYAFGGYAKFDAELARFIARFEQEHGVALEPVYSGKLLYAVYQMANQGVLPTDKPVVAIHTGGMQGLRGNTERMAKLLAQ